MDENEKELFAKINSNLELLNRTIFNLSITLAELNKSTQIANEIQRQIVRKPAIDTLIIEAQRSKNGNL